MTTYSELMAKIGLNANLAPAELELLKNYSNGLEEVAAKSQENTPHYGAALFDQAEFGIIPVELAAFECSTQSIGNNSLDAVAWDVVHLESQTFTLNPNTNTQVRVGRKSRWVHVSGRAFWGAATTGHRLLQAKIYDYTGSLINTLVLFDLPSLTSPAAPVHPFALSIDASDMGYFLFEAFQNSGGALSVGIHMSLFLVF